MERGIPKDGYPFGTKTCTDEKNVLCELQWEELMRTPQELCQFLKNYVLAMSNFV